MSKSVGLDLVADGEFRWIESSRFGRIPISPFVSQREFTSFDDLGSTKNGSTYSFTSTRLEVHRINHVGVAQVISNDG